MLVLFLLLLLLLLLIQTNCDVSYGCFDVLCNHGQTGYVISNITYIYIPANIIYDLKVLDNDYVFSDIRICLTIKSLINNYKPSCIRVENIDNDRVSIPIRLKGLYKGYWNISATYNGITETHTSTFFYDNAIEIIEITYEALISGRSTIVNPKYGSILESKLYLQMENDYITTTEAKYINLIIAGRPTEQLTVEASKVSPEIMETGSFFISVVPVLDDDEGKLSTGIPSSTYVEFVLSTENILKQRVFSDTWKKGYSSQLVKSSFENYTNVCFFSNEHMDGQRQIWLQLIEHFAQQSVAGMRFTWFIDFIDERMKNTTLPNKLRYYNEKGMLHNLLVFPKSDVGPDQLSEKDSDGSILSPERYNKESEVALYAHKRLQRAGFNISKVSPRWLKTHLSNLAETIKGAACDVIVLANGQGVGLHKLLSDVGAVVGIPVVVELCNLFVDPTLNPSIIVAPSTFAATHESIRELGNLYEDIDTLVLNDDDSDVHTTKIVLVPPAVDTNRFSDEYVTKSGGPVFNPTCSSNCITIGFVARLSGEKNVGLFLMMACVILRSHPDARFTIVGDGPLKEELIALANRLEILYAVKFMGWVDDKLPNVLRGIDIVVNPGLRETFCITNLEVMSLSIPLVTFATWGMGEYINSEYSYNSSDYSISSNGIVVHQATPMALANATINLINNSTLRHQLGAAGRETVTSYFLKERLLDQYRKLYKYLHKQRLSGKRFYGITKKYSYSLGYIAQQYDILRNLDYYQNLRSRGFPSASNNCLLSSNEQLFLYTLALNAPGSILEEGSLEEGSCGCSTTFLAAGARDQHTFYDYNSFIAMDSSGSMLNCLHGQLFQQNLHHNVTIVAGLTKNIVSMINYHLIWSYAARNEDDIIKNADTWKRLVAKSIKEQKNIIFCCHVGASKTLTNVFNEYRILSNVTVDNIYAIELSTD